MLVLEGSADDLVEHEIGVQLQYEEDGEIRLNLDPAPYEGLGEFVLQEGFDGLLVDVPMTDPATGTISSTVGSLDATDPSAPVVPLSHASLTSLAIKVTPAG